MSHYCKACCRMLDDGRFTDTGRRSHICKKCHKLPGSQRELMRATDDLATMVNQKNLSATNIARLKVLAKFPDETVRTKAAALLQVALVHPHLSKRLPYLLEKRPDLHEAYVKAFGINVEPETVAPGEPVASAGTDVAAESPEPPAPATAHPEGSLASPVTPGS